MNSRTLPKSYLGGLFYNKREVQSFVVILMEIKSLNKSSASYSADVMKPERIEHKNVKLYLVLMDQNKYFTIIKNSFNNTLIYVYLFPGELKL